MFSPSPGWEPILPYPSRTSLAELLIAKIELSSGIALPKDCPENEPYYLNRDDALNPPRLREAIEGAIRRAEPGGWLSEELAHFERSIAEDAIQYLESDPAGRTMLDAIRAVAIESYRKDPEAVSQEYGDDNAGQ